MNFFQNEILHVYPKSGQAKSMKLCTEMEKLLHMHMSLEAEVDKTECFLYDTYYACRTDDAGTYTLLYSHT